MEAADSYLNSALDEWLREIKRAWELVRLHTDHHDDAGTCVFNQPRKLVRSNTRVGFVERMNLELDIVP